MSKRKGLILGLIVLSTVFLNATVWGAAIDATWSGSITVSNPTSALATAEVNFYNQGSSTVVATKPLSLPGFSATSFATTDASLGLPPGFQGSAVISSDVPVLAQFVAWSSTPNMDRAIYNGFYPTEASADLFFPVYSHNANSQNSTLSLQNTEATDATVTLEFYNPAGGLSASVTGDTIVANSAKYFKAGSFTPTSGSLPAGWMGSVKVTCTSGQKLVGAVFQPYTVGNKVVGFEGVPAGALSIYIPSIVKNYGAVQQTTYVAVQNLTNAQVVATVDVYNTSGALALNPSPTLTIPANPKQVFNPLNYAGLINGFTGSARITAPGNIAAVANIGSQGTNFAEAYAGLTAGAQTLGLSYVRWNYQTWKTYLAIQNVSTNPVDVTVRYYDVNGALLGQKIINGVAPYAKANSNPGEVALPGGVLGIGGNATVSATGDIIVFANNITADYANAAGYTAVPYTP